MDYPKTKKVEIVENISGVEITDHYRWLEDSDLEETKNWIKYQNEIVDKELKDKGFNIFLEELVKDFKFTNFTNPYPVNNRYFYKERQPDEDQMVLYYKDGLDGKPIKIVDPNGMEENNTIRLDSWMREIQKLGLCQKTKNIFTQKFNSTNWARIQKKIN